VFVISGTPGAGKSSVSRALMARFVRGAHIPVDDLREFVVSGIAHPVAVWTPETARQFSLARGNAALLARRFSDAGFAACVDDVCSAQDFERDYAPHLSNLKPHRVLLLPSLAVALERNAMRTTKAFSSTTLEGVIRQLHAEFTAIDKPGWLVVDSSVLSVEETVDRILELTGVTP
jgi:thymidylate kinase